MEIKTIHVLLIAFVMHLTQSFAQPKSSEADKIIGIFWSPKKDAKIEIYKKGDAYFGKSIWVAIPRKDLQNPTISLRKREVLGIVLLSNFSYLDGEYTKGMIYDPASGKTYNCKMSLLGDTLKVRGYIGVSLFGRTEIFERIKTK